jgi:2,3-dihydroxy-p-cumate/2,3-dihydroxybenzoate 3,4-dioxygenase
MRYRCLAAVTLNVSDAARSRSFYDELPGNGSGILLERAETPGLKRMTFEVEDTGTLEELATAFDHLGIRWTAIGARAMRFVEPHIGVAVDLSADRGPAGSLGHIVLRSGSYRDSVTFWRDVMGFRVSDEIDGRITFLRCFPNPVHHSLAIVNSDRSGLHHLNLHAKSPGDVDRMACELPKRGVPVMCGPARHTPTGNRFLFFLDPDGLTTEISAGTEYFDEHAPRAARLLPDRPESFDDGTSPRDPRIFSVGSIEDARALQIKNGIGV